MSIYENLLFLHGHLADPRLVAPHREPADAHTTRKTARSPVPPVQPRRRVRGVAPMRSLGDCG